MQHMILLAVLSGMLLYVLIIAGCFYVILAGTVGGRPDHPCCYLNGFEHSLEAPACSKLSPIDAASLQKVSAHLELSKPPPQTAQKTD